MLRNKRSYIALSFCNLDSILLETDEELLGINLSVSIVGIEELEGPAKSSDGGRSSLVQLSSQSVKNYRKR